MFRNLEVPVSSLGLNEIFNGFPQSLYASTKFCRINPRTSAPTIITFPDPLNILHFKPV